MALTLQTSENYNVLISVSSGPEERLALYLNFLVVEAAASAGQQVQNTLQLVGAAGNISEGSTVQVQLEGGFFLTTSANSLISSSPDASNAINFTVAELTSRADRVSFKLQQSGETLRAVEWHGVRYIRPAAWRPPSELTFTLRAIETSSDVSHWPIGLVAPTRVAFQAGGGRLFQTLKVAAPGEPFAGLVQAALPNMENGFFTQLELKGTGDVVNDGDDVKVFVHVTDQPGYYWKMQQRRWPNTTADLPSVQSVASEGEASTFKAYYRPNNRSVILEHEGTALRTFWEADGMFFGFVAATFGEEIVLDNYRRFTFEEAGATKVASGAYPVTLRTSDLTMQALDNGTLKFKRFSDTHRSSVMFEAASNGSLSFYTIDSEPVYIKMLAPYPETDNEYGDIYQYVKIENDNSVRVVTNRTLATTFNVTVERGLDAETIQVTLAASGAANQYLYMAAGNVLMARSSQAHAFEVSAARLSQEGPEQAWNPTFMRDSISFKEWANANMSDGNGPARNAVFWFGNSITDNMKQIDGRDHDALMQNMMGSWTWNRVTNTFVAKAANNDVWDDLSTSAGSFMVNFALASSRVRNNVFVFRNVVEKLRALSVKGFVINCGFNDGFIFPLQYALLYQRIREAFPTKPIMLLSVYPRLSSESYWNAGNTILSLLDGQNLFQDPNTHYVDVPAYTDEPTFLLEVPDRVHPNAKGYQTLFSNATIRAHFARVFGSA